MLPKQYDLCFSGWLAVNFGLSAPASYGEKAGVGERPR